jgi:MFS family permease
MFGARLGDRMGHRRCILGSVALFAIGALLAATATTLVTLTIARCVQGAAAAAAVPSALALLVSVAGDGRARDRAVAAWSAAGAVAGGCGFVVGGAVSEVGSWRIIFWGLLVVSAAQALLIFKVVRPQSPSRHRQALNLPGTLLLTFTVMLIVLGATLLGEPSSRTAGGLVLAAAFPAFALFVVADRRSSAPLMPRAVLRRPQVRRGSTGAFVNTASTGGVATLITLYLQGTLGRTPWETALTLLPFSLFVIGGSALAARLMVGLTRERIAAAGLALVCVGIAAPLLDPVSAVLVSAGMAVAGFGLGLSSVTTTSMATDVPEEFRATSSGIVNTSAQLGTAIGTAAILLVAAVTTGVPGGSTTRAPMVGWAAAAGCALIAAGVFVRLRTFARRSP